MYRMVCERKLTFSSGKIIHLNRFLVQLMHKISKMLCYMRLQNRLVNVARRWIMPSLPLPLLKVHKREKFFVSDFEFFTIL